MAFKLGMMVDLFIAYYAHGHVDDLDLDARSQWLGRVKKSALNLSNNH